MPNAHLGARLARPVRLFALTVLALAACSDGGGSGPAAPSLDLEAAGPPMTVVSGTITGVTVSPTPLTGTVGGASVTIVTGEGGEFAFAIPALAEGPHPFTMEIGGTTLSATVQVTAPVQISDPAAYLSGVLDVGEADFDALEAELASAPDDAALDTAQRRQDLARIRAILADARQQLAGATPAELATAAAFISANDDAFGISPSTSSLVHGGLSLATSGSGACLDAEGNTLDTYEECHVQFKAFGRNAVKRLVVLAGATAIAYVEGFSVIGSIGAAITAVAIYRELEKIQTGTFKRFIDPVTARLLSAFGSSQRRGPSLQVQGGTDAEPEYFVADESRVFRVRGEYRSLRASDAGSRGYRRSSRSGSPLNGS